MKTYPYLSNNDKKAIDNLFLNLKKLLILHPNLVIMILHEYNRSLYRVDPYINFTGSNHLKRIRSLIKFLNLYSKMSLLIGSYNTNKKKNFFYNNKNKKNSDVKSITGNVYGKLWKDFRKKNNIEAIKLLKNRLPHTIFKNKYVLDDGCGGGRYSYAIKKLGAKKVIGVDYGLEGINLAKKNYKSEKSLIFKKANVLSLPFKKNTFDVVFSNGVLHHTTSIKKGMNEVLRVCKPGGKIWLYLYTKGGIFWYSRKLMNKFFKQIPYDYTYKILKEIGLPENRFIFMDNWYVPIEKHPSHADIYNILKKNNVKKIEKIVGKNQFDLDFSLKKHPGSQKIWGEGEIRLLITK